MTREQKILRLNAALIALPFGILFSAAALPAVYDAWSIFFNVVHWPFHSAPEALDPTGRLLIAISGGLAAGMGAVVWTVSTHVLPVAPEAGRAVIRNMALTWFVVDSTFSVVAGSPMNVVANLILLAMLILPIMRTRPDPQEA